MKGIRLAVIHFYDYIILVKLLLKKNIHQAILLELVFGGIEHMKNHLMENIYF